MSKILVSGSLAYDRIMDFPGRFRDHIMLDKVHLLNVAFNVDNLRESFGGTAGNIAYSLALLGEQPKVVSTAGSDFSIYQQWLQKNGIDISLVKVRQNRLTSSAFIVTDQEDNQITSFYGSSADVQHYQRVAKIQSADLAIISPDNHNNMLAAAKACQHSGTPYIFDPGQALFSFSSSELKPAVKGARILIGNDYEVGMMGKMLKARIDRSQKLVEILIITKGNKGDEIYTQGKKLIIPPAKPKAIVDPTGAGDAFRAGFIKGLLAGYPLAKAGRLGNTVAVYTVEQYGTQTHHFTWQEIARRYRQNFKEEL